jgi:hypothetical protein
MLLLWFNSLGSRLISKVPEITVKKLQMRADVSNAVGSSKAGVKKNPMTLLGIEPRPSSSWPVDILTELFRLPVILLYIFIRRHKRPIFLITLYYSFSDVYNLYTLLEYHGIYALSEWVKQKHLDTFHQYTRCDNLIHGKSAACRWGIESGKLMYPSTFGHIPTCVDLSHRPNESFVPKQQRKQDESLVYCWRKSEWQESGAADKHHFCVKIGKSASET